jgi:pimeloyl-ACP methyl ester carboxylesterase
MISAGDWYFIEQGQGPALLLIHGLGASSFSWRYNLEPLARYFRVLAPDLPGHGRSPAVLTADYRLEALTRGLMDFLDRHGVQQATVAGNSLGGSLALLLARDYPARVKALILLAPGVAIRRLPYLFYPLRLPGLGLLAAALLGPWIIPYALRLIYYRRQLITSEVVAGYAAPYRDLSRRLALRRLCHQLQLPPASEIEGMLKKISQPTTIIWGKKDLILPVPQAGWLADRLPQAEVRLLGEVGHAPQEEAPDTVNKIIIDFLTRSFKK